MKLRDDIQGKLAALERQHLRWEMYYKLKPTLTGLNPCVETVMQPRWG